MTSANFKRGDRVVVREDLDSSELFHKLWPDEAAAKDDVAGGVGTIVALSTCGEFVTMVADDLADNAEDIDDDGMPRIYGWVLPTWALTFAEPESEPASENETGDKPTWRENADAAVSLMVRAGWADARHDSDSTSTWLYVGLRIVVGTRVWRASGPDIELGYRDDRTLTECAKVIIRDAVERNEAPDMAAATAMVAEWDAEPGSTSSEVSS